MASEVKVSESYWFRNECLAAVDALDDMLANTRRLLGSERSKLIDARDVVTELLRHDTEENTAL